MKQILDVGSGHNPFPLATILSDLFLEGFEHRPNDMEAKIDERPFIVCDIQQLPFKTRIFDYVHCRHVIEHVADPKRAIAELKRVGKNGSIAIPTLFREIFKGSHASHKWIVDTDGSAKQLPSFFRSWGIISRKLLGRFKIRLRERISLILCLEQFDTTNIEW